MRSIDGRVLSARRSALVLAAITLFLAAVLLAQATFLFGDGQPEKISRDSQRALDIPALAAVATWPDASTTAVEGRALFAPKIAAVAPPPVEAAPPEQPREQLFLIAVVIEPAGKFALLRTQQSEDVRKVEEGGTVGGWSLAAVEANRVILEDAGQQIALYLPDTAPEAP